VELSALLKHLQTHYPLAIERVEFLAQTHHTVYRVWAQEGHFVLRLYKTDTPLARVTREVELLSILKIYNLPQVHIAIDGQSITSFNQQYAILQDYVNGQHRTLQDIRSEDVALIGRWLGRLHALNLHTDEQQRYDVAGLFGEQGVYPIKELSDEHQARVQVLLKHFDVFWQTPRPTCLLHGDCLLHNILFDKQQVRLIDVEYSAEGYPLYDLAPLLWQLKTHPDYNALKQAYWQSYSQAYPQLQHAESNLELMIAMRQLASMVWVAQNSKQSYIYPHAQRIIEHRLLELEAYLHTGELQRTPFIP
jgi:Ser/Thr protein kinase RdoA (MazF antagonist)